MTLVWIVSYLINDGEQVEGHKTAVEASDILSASCRTRTHIYNNFDPRKVRFLITDIGLADDKSREHIGKVLDDPLALDWPSDLEVRR